MYKLKEPNSTFSVYYFNEENKLIPGIGTV